MDGQDMLDKAIKKEKGTDSSDTGNLGTRRRKRGTELIWRVYSSSSKAELIYGKPTQQALTFLFKPLLFTSGTLISFQHRLLAHSFHLAFKILPLDQVRNIVIVVVVVPAVLLVAPVPTHAAAVLFLQALVAFRQFAQRGQTVRPKLVEDARHEFGELLVFARAVDGEGVRGYRGVD